MYSWVFEIVKRAMKKYIILIFLLLCWIKESYSSVKKDDQCSSIIQSLKDQAIHSQLRGIYRTEKFDVDLEILNQNLSYDAQMRFVKTAALKGGEEGTQIFLKILEQDSIDVGVQREIAYWAGGIGGTAGGIGGTAGAKVLLKILEQKPTDVKVQREIADSAGEIGGTVGAEVLLKILEQKPY